MAKFTASPLPLFGVLLLALALRVWGLPWGLPSATHYFSYHPDESVVLETSSLTMNVFAGRLLPHFYNYGSLQLYLVCFANTLAALFGYVDIVPKDFSVWYPQWAKMYLIGRCLTVGMGVGTVWATYALGARLWGRRAGLFAALILAVTPLHAQHSHFLTVDVPATFWVMLSLLWSARLATDDPKPLKAALCAGVFAGLATATKYNMALAVLPLIAACAMRFAPEPTSLLRNKLLRRGPPHGGGQKVSEGRGKPCPYSSPARFRKVGACAGVGFFAFALAFFAACPGAILESGSFFRDFHAEAVHVQNTDDPTFRDTGNGFVYQITHNLDAGLGWPLLALTLVSIGYALYRRQRGDGLLAAFALPYYILISLAAVRYARYTIPLLPILALWAGRMLADGSRLPNRLAQRATAAAAALVFVSAFGDAVKLVLPMAQTDPRDTAFVWMQAHAPSATIGFAAQPWFGTVPISPYFTLPRPGGGQTVTPPDIARRIVYGGKDWDTDLLQMRRPEFVVLSEYDYDDALRLQDPAASAYIAAVTRDYTRRLILPKKFQNQPDFPSSGLPHDMTYTNPAISIYQRR